MQSCIKDKISLLKNIVSKETFYPHLNTTYHPQPRHNHHYMNKDMSQWYCYTYADNPHSKQHDEMFSCIHLYLKQNGRCSLKRANFHGRRCEPI